ncbi:transposase [Permianibacter sp. IMCC34836]|uniref:REP-associated tyrosine transposase n=1 Tax=Permianibacter fluminis TaxID=2738515 RepID=UPI00155682AC|nr:transposase [Permianibacter fluminis]NQD36486.1 transposase [Permianibacter fluminis]
MERPHSRSLRIGRYSAHRGFYLLTACTYQRQPHFLTLNIARALVLEMLACDRDGLTCTYCYVVMPDHLHWLVELKSISLSLLMRRVKARASLKVAKLHGVKPLWQGGFHDRAIRQEADLQALARYVVANPLRRGLVTNVAEYPHWDAVWLG